MILVIWNSFRRTPLWVQVWVVVILMPINSAALIFYDEYLGGWVAFLAVVGMLPNIPIMLIDRGVSKQMSVPHVLVWTLLCVLIVWLLQGHFGGTHRLPEQYTYFLIVLLVIDVISLAFDFRDSLQWWRGDRAIA